MTARDGVGARELARMLAQRAPELVAELLPHGRREGREWRVGSLAGEAGQSLGVCIAGDRSGVWSDFSSGEAGDSLDLVAAVRFAGNTPDAMRWARQWLGLGDGTTVPAPTARRAPEPARPAVDVEGQAKRRKALALFAEAQEPITGTPADDYLKARSLDLRTPGRVPRALRFHPACWCAEVSAPLPAMLGAITGPDGAHQATHRTWLSRRPDGTWGKAPLDRAKKVLGGFAGGAIRVWRGAGGRPLAEAEAGEVVALAEGIETALSVALAAPELRVLCVVSLGNLARVELPASVSTIVVCADNDEGNDAAARALARALDRFAGEGREVRLARPPVGVGDFNDMIRMEAARHE